MKPVAICPACGHAKARHNGGRYCFACDTKIARQAHDRAVARLLDKEMPVAPVTRALADALLELPVGEYVTIAHLERRMGIPLPKQSVYRAVLKLRSAGWTITGRNGRDGGGYCLG
jgi:hypothetical protein